MRIIDTPLYKAATRTLGDMDLLDAEVETARSATWAQPEGEQRINAARHYFALRRDQEAARARYAEASERLTTACLALGVTPPLPTA
jgi:hypothetical protein